MIKFLVTQDRFDEIFSIDEWLNFGEITNADMYKNMQSFVVGENGEYLAPEEARKQFKTIKKREWNGYIANFVSAVNDAFVNPTKGDDSSSPPKQADELPPTG